MDARQQRENDSAINLNFSPPYSQSDHGLAVQLQPQINQQDPAQSASLGAFYFQISIEYNLFNDWSIENCIYLPNLCENSFTLLLLLYFRIISIFADGWMPIPQCISNNCPDGLQYLTTVDKLNIVQKVHLLESNKKIS